eukprot:TRINITY_DN3579_c0_g1_i1.p1 TRINITY_DN3579_c0_g1~~TRINITY_DN3579_c0_g1_i1.p1  ORF type:complete len:686 (-),score=79.98 TRINITY_DN3579_c0_g1_i1:96-2153(-)
MLLLLLLLLLKNRAERGPIMATAGRRRSTAHRRLSTFTKVECESKKWLKPYTEMIESCLQDGIIQEGEMHLLKVYRKQHGLTMEDHNQALQTISTHATEDFKECKEVGEEKPEEKYGWSEEDEKNYSTYYYSPENFSREEKMVKMNGAVIVPHLRQWYVKHTPTKENPHINTYVRQASEHKASFLELFFDLVFVTIIQKLAHVLEHDPQDLGKFIVLYTAVWQVWMNMTLYANRYEHHDWMHVPVYFVTMFGAVAMSLEIDHAVAGREAESQIFSVAFIFAVLPVLTMYLFAAYWELAQYRPSIPRRRQNKYSSRSYTFHPLVMALWLIVSLIPWIIAVSSGHYFYPCWIAGLIIQELGNIFTNFYFYFDAPVAVDHWGERLALFVMIHLGESMFSISAVTLESGAIDDLTWQVTFIAAMGLITGFSIRRVYFEIEGEEPKAPHALRDRYLFNLYTLAHWILCMGIIIFAVGQVKLEEYIAEEVTALAGNSSTTSSTSTHKRYISGGVPVAPVETTPTETNGTHTTSGVSEVIHEIEVTAQQFKWVYCGSLCLILIIITIIGAISRPSHEVKYHVAHPHILKGFVRIGLALIVILLPLTNVDQLPVFGLVVTVSLLFFTWAIIESALVLKKVHGHHHHSDSEEESEEEEMKAPSHKNQEKSVSENPTQKSGEEKSSSEEYHMMNS